MHELKPTTFTAPQSILAFSIPISVVVTVSRTARTMFRSDSESLLIPSVAAIAVCALLAAMALADPRNRPRSTAQWLTCLAIAFINTFVVLAAALGIEKF